MTILKTAPRLLLIASLALGGATASLAADTVAHTHMGHVTESWADTPDAQGLLPTAIAEAEIAVFHAGLAAQKLDDLGWMKTHANHILHAVDPSAIANGPGLGYGVLEAATGVAKHIGFAAAADDASDNVKTHAVHVATSANNTVARVAAIKANIATIEAATTAAEAAEATRANVALTTALLEGVDANGDGMVDWTEGEGGLNEALKHMGIMAAGEDM